MNHTPLLLTLSAVCLKRSESCTFEQLTSFRLAGISQPAVPLDHIELLRQKCAGVVELVDAPDSKSGSERSVGSIPTTRTIYPTTRFISSRRFKRLRQIGDQIVRMFDTDGKPDRRFQYADTLSHVDGNARMGHRSRVARK